MQILHILLYSELSDRGYLYMTGAILAGILYILTGDKLIPKD